MIRSYVRPGTQRRSPRAGPRLGAGSRSRRGFAARSRSARKLSGSVEPGSARVRTSRTLTVARHTEPLRFATVEEAIEGLRGEGLRLSAARRLVLEALFLADGPVSAEELAAGLGGQVPP